MTPPLIVLADRAGERLRPLTDDRPECMVRLAGRSLIQWQLAAAREADVSSIRVVGGYRVDQLDVPRELVLENPDFSSTGQILTLLCAEPYFGSGFVTSYGNIVYNPDVLEALHAAEADIAVVVDRAWQEYFELRYDDVAAVAEQLTLDENGNLASLGGPAPNLDEIEGRFIGLAAFRGEGLAHALELLDREREVFSDGARLLSERTYPELELIDLLRGLIADRARVQPIFVDGGWIEISTPDDLELAERMVEVDGPLLIVRR